MPWNKRPMKKISKTVSNTIQSPVPRIFILGGVNGGGSLKFVHDFTQIFPNAIHIHTATQLQSYTYDVNDILFCQQLYDTNITHTMICSIYEKYTCRIILSIHDFYYFILSCDKEAHSSYVDTNISIDPIISKLFACAELVIHPSTFTYEIYRTYFPSHNCIISPHIDYTILESNMYIPPITDKTIHIGMFSENTECKGKEYIEFLTTIKQYKGYTIKIHIVGETIPTYKEHEFFTYIKKYNIHCLLALNKWGETYSYAISKYLKSGLPILYNNIGSYRERIPEKPHYMKVCTEENQCNDKQLLIDTFHRMILYIVTHAGVGAENMIVDTSIHVPSIYTFVYNPMYSDRTIWNTIYTRIKPFCIYFPQFHQLEENDKNYYPGMTDMKNLIEYIKDGNDDKLDSPDINTLGITSLDEYDLSNPILVNRQIAVARSAGIYGFCIYYYWFSNNTITGKHSIMEKCYDNFFKEELQDFKVFFNWANEDWTKNPAFVKDNDIDISNTYTDEYITANFENLVKYFKHPNYYKINNCPVFYIHHPWFMTEKEIERIIHIFRTSALRIGFNGIHVVVNSMVRKYSTDTFVFSPNYKDPKYNGEYTQLTTDYDNTVPSTIFFSFNNRARMYKPRKHAIASIRNSTHVNQKKALIACVNKYKYGERTELNTIVLINSWNEWGENMAIEPGTQNGYFYLHLLRSVLTSVLPCADLKLTGKDCI